MYGISFRFVRYNKGRTHDDQTYQDLSPVHLPVSLLFLFRSFSSSTGPSDLLGHLHRRFFLPKARRCLIPSLPFLHKIGKELFKVFYRVTTNAREQ